MSYSSHHLRGSRMVEENMYQSLHWDSVPQLAASTRPDIAFSQQNSQFSTHPDIGFGGSLLNQSTNHPAFQSTFPRSLSQLVPHSMEFPFPMGTIDPANNYMGSYTPLSTYTLPTPSPLPLSPKSIDAYLLAREANNSVSYRSTSSRGISRTDIENVAINFRTSTIRNARGLSRSVRQYRGNVSDNAIPCRPHPL